MKTPLPSTSFNYRSIILTFSLIILVFSISFAQTIRYVATNGVDTNPGTALSPYLTITKAISDAVAGDVIQLAAGSYNEQVKINKAVTIDGVDSTNRIVTFTGTPVAVSGLFGVFAVSAANVTIKNMQIIVDLSKINSAITMSGTSNLVITGNTIISDKSGTGYFGNYTPRIGISINSSTNVIIQSNTVDSRNGGKFRASIQTDDITGLTIGGAAVSQGNNFLASVNHDALIRSYLGTQTVSNNIFKGGGVEVANSKSNGSFVVSNNLFDGTYAHSIPTAMVRIFTNAYLNRTINFSYNHFVKQKWTVSFENTRNVVLDHNDLTAAYDSFRLISVNSKLRQSYDPGILETIDIKLTNNTLSAIPGLTTGNALEFLNLDQRAPNNYVKGNYVIGEPGNENIFNANIPTFVKVSNLNGYNTGLQSFFDLYPEYNGTQVISTTGYWIRDIFARYNKYYVNGKLKFATSFSTDDYNKVYDKIFDRQDDINVGAVVMMPTWSGAKNTDWAIDSNWSYRFIPAKGLDAVIYPQVNNPELFADAACDSIILSNNMSIKTGIHSLTIYGNIRSNGIMNATIGSITLAGDSSQVLTGNMIIKNLILNNVKGAVITAGINNKVNVLGKYTPTLGVLTTNDNLVLKSTDTGTASIATFTGTGDYINGKVTVERFIPARRSWRFLTAPVNATDAITIREAWQEGVNNCDLVTGNNKNPAPGYGTHITLGNSTALGFDMGINNNTSIKGFNPVTVTWDPLPTTNIPLNSYPAYMLFVRGDRSNILSQGAYATATNTVLRSLGNVKMGDQHFTVAANGFTLMANPYPAAIDLASIVKSNVQNNFYVWDSKITEVNGVGGYVTLSWDGLSGYDRVPWFNDGISQYVQSGSAFFALSLDGDHTGTLTIKEGDKTNLGSDKVYRPQDAPSVAKLLTNVYAINTDGTSSLIDATLNSFGLPYSNAVDYMDAIKLGKLSESFSTQRQDKQLTVERRQPVTSSDTIYYRMAYLKLRSYTFEFIPTGFGTANLSGFLVDNYLHTSTPVALNTTARISFVVSIDSGAWAPGRFRMVFRPLAPLPVTFKSIRAWQQADAVKIEWKVEYESGIRQYEVETSADGIGFTKAATIPAGAAGTAIYNWLHSVPFEGNNYYRVKSVGEDGAVQYSAVAKIYISKGRSQLIVDTKLVTGSTIAFHLVNMKAGIYGIRLFNDIGQVILTKQITCNSGNSTEDIDLNTRPAKGIYKLQFITPGNKKITENVFIQ